MADTIEELTAKVRAARVLREANDIKQWWVARKLNLHQTDLSHVETGLRMGPDVEAYLAFMARPIDELKKEFEADSRELKAARAQARIEGDLANGRLAGGVAPRNIAKVDIRRIVDARHARGMTPKQLAEATGYSAATITRMERGAHVSQNTYDRYLKLLELIPTKKAAVRGSDKPAMTQLPLPTPAPKSAPIATPAIPVVEEPATRVFAGKFLPTGSNAFDHIECDGKTLYSFTPVPGGVWLAVVGTYRMEKKS